MSTWMNTMRVSIICPRCVRTVRQYMLTAGEHEIIEVPRCPWCDGDKQDMKADKTGANDG